MSHALVRPVKCQQVVRENETSQASVDIRKEEREVEAVDNIWSQGQHQPCK